MSETVDRLLRRAGSIRLALSRIDASARVPRRQGYKLGLRGALTALVLGTVVLTALLIHLFWSIAARRNVGDVVGQLNRQIVESIHHELHGVLDDASSMEEAVRSIFFQGTIKVTDEGKREFVFLALLRSQPSLSWISLGFPDGGFFGSRKASDTEIDMIELSDYLELASAAISTRNGTIDKFIGDAVMAFWGAPTPNDRHAVDACAAALEFRRRLSRHSTDSAVPLRMRVGINTGPMLVGNIGSSERLSYTVIGDAVNVASRLEAVNKRYGTEILIGEDTRAAAGDVILVRRLDWVAVYGRTQGLAVYELLGMADHGALRQPEWVTAYEAGLDAYARRDWSGAAELFESAIAIRGDDLPSQIFVERCRKYLASPPPEDWTAVSILAEK